MDVVHSSPLVLKQEDSSKKDAVIVTETEVDVSDLAFNVADQNQKSLEAIRQAAWTAGITDSIQETILFGAEIARPSILRKLPSELLGLKPDSQPLAARSQPKAAPENFAISGEIKLFDSDKLIVDFYSYYGPRPSWLPSDDPAIPIYQMAALREELRLSSLFPSLAGDSCDFISLKNVWLTYQNMPIDNTNVVGLTLSSTIEFDECYGALHKFLTEFLRMQKPALTVSCGFENHSAWNKLPNIDKFMLTGTFTNLEPKPPAGKVQMTKVGARITRFSNWVTDDEGQLVSEGEYGYGLFGTMLVEVPGSPLAPVTLELGFSADLHGDFLLLRASLDTPWKQAFGINCLTLDDVVLQISFDKNRLRDSLTFNMLAAFEVNNTSVGLSGTFSTRGDFELEAQINDLDFRDLSNVFKDFFGDELEIPEIPVHIGTLVLAISKQDGVTFIVRDLQIGDHIAAEATVEISPGGVLFKGSIAGDLLDIHGFKIKKAYAEIKVSRLSGAKRQSSTKASVIFGGEAEWNDHSLSVGIHVYQSPDEGKNKLDYTIIASFATEENKDGIPFAQLIPKAKNTILEQVSLKDAALIVASREDAESGSFNKSGFPIRKGIRLCALLGEIKPLNDFLRAEKPAELAICAAWTPGIGFSVSLDIMATNLPPINFGGGVVTESLELSVRLGRSAALALVTIIKIPVKGREKNPLRFILDFEITPMDATLTGQLEAKGGWKNPFGMLGDDVIVGPDLALTLGINWATFAAKGPSKIGFVGGLQIGKVSGNLACVFNELPSQQLLWMKLEHLDVQDIADFAALVTQKEIEPPPNVIKLHKFELYACPAGMKVGLLDFPPGFSFSADVTIFDINADAMCSIGSGGFECKGGIDPFTLGALTIQGANGGRAVFDMALNSSKQEGKIDGMAYISDLQVVIVANFKLRPELVFDFFFFLDYCKLFTIKVQAYPLKPPTEQSAKVKTTDYRLEAEFQKEIKSNMAGKLDKMFEEKAKKNKEEKEKRLKELKRAREAWKQVYAAKEQHQKIAKAEWLAKKANTQKEEAEMRAEIDVKITKCLADLDDTTKKWNTEVGSKLAAWSKEKTEGEARVQRDTIIRDAVHAKCDKEIEDARHDLTSASKYLNDQFGNLLGKIETAKRELKEIDDDITRRKQDLWINPPRANGMFDFLRNDPRGGELFARQVTRDGAERILKELEQALRTTSYVSAQSQEELRRRALKFAEENQPLLEAAAEKTLQETMNTRDSLVEEAYKAHQKSEKLSKDAISAASLLHKKASEEKPQVYEKAAQLLNGLKTCKEYVEYEAAELDLKLEKEAGERLLDAGESVVKVGNDLSEQVTELWHDILKAGGQFVDITHVKLKAQLGALVGGASFEAHVEGYIGEQQQYPFTYDVAYDIKEVSKFLESLYNKLVAEVETIARNEMAKRRGLK